LQEGWGVTISLVARYPPGLETTGSHDALDHLGSDLMLGLKRDLVRNLAILPQRLVLLIKPGLRQVQPPIKERSSFATRIA